MHAERLKEADIQTGQDRAGVQTHTDKGIHTYRQTEPQTDMGT